MRGRLGHGVIATFAHPRYELYGAGTVFDGEAAVRGYFAASRIPFPDQANEIIAIAAEGDTVLVEFWLTGTHRGPLRTPKGEIAPTGKAFRVRMMRASNSRQIPRRSSASAPISTDAP
jgi:ketosteroid isomerase-like protein